MKFSIKLLIFVLAIILFFGFFYYFNGNKPTYTTKELKTIEIKEYEGENLSSINDLRENSIKGPQYVGRDQYKLEIVNAGENYSLTYDEILDNYQSYEKLVRLDCVEGWSVDILWEGVLVRDLFDLDKIPNNVNTVIFYAYDGYSTSFPLDYILDNDIIMAYKMNGVELPPERGFPFQLVAESKWGYKWIKWITKIEFSSDEEYQGYWESRGYSNQGDLDKSFFDN